MYKIYPLFTLLRIRKIAIHSIRNGRAKPGLLAQHLTGVKLMATLTEGELLGASLHSKNLIFTPKEISQQQKHSADIRTAG